ncbi:Threonine/homoserine/homoserine lactone efflux protein [Saccharopolyspora kobensis]|uniref:Threonine/homoserine/homoserine lactone efflux protein n=1 Tax=Saccharopolyspora kobensis TaxID=146035 RepID=A0A1H6BTG3_9PSEU|nr:LysE family translocator [Saccharopolyspora kobensis]SEG63994.1 Threonine/homoserine/homoserine lactone efflux protein [Saccharopolyspora kobensis]SFC15465.1 Threonine/homoserine/homoserine lactone efflux protein [Saccharopolyspora kobensis]
MLVDLTPLPAFLVASVVVVLTPGVDVFLLLRTSLNRGRRAGMLALAGIHTASILQVALVISGLGALVTKHPAVLSALKWIGAAYLVYLAASILRGLWLTRKKSAEGTLSGPPVDNSNPYLRGLFSNLTNPKMLLFSLAFLPQFVGSAPQPALQLVMLGVVFLVLALIWEASMVLGAAKIADRLQNPRVAKSLDVVSAAAFLTISVGLVAG